MARSRETKIELTAYDDLFQTDESREEAKLSKIRDIAYKMRLEAMDRQGKRSDLTSTPLVSKSRSNEELADRVGESREQIRRYIRLTVSRKICG